MRTLEKQCLRKVHSSWSTHKDICFTSDQLATLPPHLQKLVLCYLNKERRWGQRAFMRADVTRFLTHNATYITFEGFWLGHEAFRLDQLPQNPLLHLNHLCLRDTKYIGADKLQFLLSLSPNLAYVDLVGNHDVTVQVLITLLKTSHDTLRHIAASIPQVAWDPQLSLFSTLPNLEYLLLDRARRLAFPAGFRLPWCLNFLHLDQAQCVLLESLAGCISLRRLELKRIKGHLGTCPLPTNLQECLFKEVDCLHDVSPLQFPASLISLEIIACKQVDSRWLSCFGAPPAIAKPAAVEGEEPPDELPPPVERNQKFTLQSIHLQLLRRVDDVSHLSAIPNLSITLCRNITRRSFAFVEAPLCSLEVTFCSISGALAPPRVCTVDSLTRLSLDGSSCTDAEVVQLLADSPLLRRLSIQMCSRITGGAEGLFPSVCALESLEELAVGSCPKLHRLSLAESRSLRWLTAADLQLDSCELPAQLQVLKLSRCTGEARLSGVFSSCPSIKELWITESPLMTAAALRSLFENNARLRIANFSGSREIAWSRELCARLKELPRLRRVYLNECSIGHEEKAEIYALSDSRITYCVSTTTKPDPDADSP